MSEIQIKISDVINLLEEGNNREAIATHYGLEKNEVNELFKHPSLKGKRPKKAKPAPRFTIVDDTVEDSTTDEGITNPSSDNAAITTSDSFIKPVTDIERKDEDYELGLEEVTADTDFSSVD